MKPHRVLLTIPAGTVALALAPANAAAQLRGGPVHGGGGRSVVVVRPAYGPCYGDLFGDIPVNPAGADRSRRLSFLDRGEAPIHDDLRGVSGSIALQLGGR